MKKIAIITCLILSFANAQGMHEVEHPPVEDPRHQELEAQREHEKQQEELHAHQQEEAQKAAEQKYLEELREKEIAQKEQALEAEEKHLEESHTEESDNQISDCIKEVVTKRLVGSESQEKKEEIKNSLDKLTLAIRNLTRYEAQKFTQTYASMTNQDLIAERTKALHTDTESLYYDLHYTDLIKGVQTLQVDLAQSQATLDLLDDVMQECFHGTGSPPSIAPAQPGLEIFLSENQFLE